MRITTKTGDQGKTMVNGVLVDKDSETIEAMGSLDELMAGLGMMESNFDKINHQLYLIMGVISGYGKEILDLRSQISDLENEMEKLENKLEPISEFLKTGKQLDVKLNWVRTVCRRAERRLVSLNKVQQIDPNILIYINRLSDYLFIKASISEKL